MEKIITAEELLNQRVYITDDGVEDVHDSLANVRDAMIEFATMHVEAALEAAEKSIKIGLSRKAKDLILSAYPLENIK